MRNFWKKVVCFFNGHVWPKEWTEGKIGENFFLREQKCERCETVRGRGGILPPKPWPKPPAKVKG